MKSYWSSYCCIGPVKRQKRLLLLKMSALLSEDNWIAIGIHCDLFPSWRSLVTYDAEGYKKYWKGRMKGFMCWSSWEHGRILCLKKASVLEQNQVTTAEQCRWLSIATLLLSLPFSFTNILPSVFFSSWLSALLLAFKAI